MQSDLNILQVWSQGLSGQGVVVSVLDDGIEKDHPDLWANYVSLQGWGGGCLMSSSWWEPPYVSTPSPRIPWPAMTSMTMTQTPNLGTHPAMRTGKPGIPRGMGADPVSLQGARGM